MSDQMRKTSADNIKSPFTTAGRTPWEEADDLGNKSNINEEYKEAFRTNSYLDLWSKVQRQLGRTSLDTRRSSSSHSFHTHLSEFLLEPRQETLVDMIESLNFHHLVMDYFEASFEACNLCELVLKSIHQTRSNYRKIKRVIEISKRLHTFSDYTYEHEGQCGDIFKELAGFALLKNPLSTTIGPGIFKQMHDSNIELLHELTSKHKKIRRRAKFKRVCKKIGGIGLVISQSAIVVAMLVLALHSLIGIAAVPGLLACTPGLCRKKIKSVKKVFNTSGLERLGAQLDIAAKGTFIVINDFDTMSRLVWRLHDEIEHLKAIASTCIRNRKSEVLKEVVKEFCRHESSFLEQLEELEQHIYLCFHTINRSRRLVMQEIIDDVRT